MNVLLEFINDITKDDMELNHTDINMKQIAAQPGTCQQGITPNDNFAGDGKMPSDETVARLMQQSYASRFGQWCGTVGSGRTSLGMWDGTGPQNVNASTDAPAS